MFEKDTIQFKSNGHIYFLNSLIEWWLFSKLVIPNPWQWTLAFQMEFPYLVTKITGCITSSCGDLLLQYTHCEILGPYFKWEFILFSVSQLKYSVFWLRSMVYSEYPCIMQAKVLACKHGHILNKTFHIPDISLK